MLGRRFDTIKEIKNELKKGLNAIPENDYSGFDYSEQDEIDLYE